MKNIAVSSAGVERAFSAMNSSPVLNDVDPNKGYESFCKQPIGQQEYSSRQAGVTTGIIAAVLVPILLVLVCVVYQLFVRNKKNAEQQQQQVADPVTVPLKSSDPIVRHSEFDSDDLAPYKRNSDDSNTFKKGETEIQ
uniref:Uncharacterized protein n=1 Tax=Timema cristinae TaxID=61476 RepID=A0A7R9H683_TIMCR|nr:unnamed protein product [Timema cristinae]